jgi:hypothetical protein
VIEQPDEIGMVAAKSPLADAESAREEGFRLGRGAASDPESTEARQGGNQPDVVGAEGVLGDLQGTKKQLLRGGAVSVLALQLTELDQGGGEVGVPSLEPFGHPDRGSKRLLGTSAIAAAKGETRRLDALLVSGRCVGHERDEPRLVPRERRGGAW